MRNLTLSIVAAGLVGFSVPVTASTGENITENQSIRIGGHISGWRAVSRDEVIVWATPSRPYLIKMHHRFVGLRFADTIGVTTSAGRVTKFDNIIVDGQRLPIKSIKALDRKTAKDLRWSR